MSGEGAPTEGLELAHQARVALIAGRWHTVVSDGLINGALSVLNGAQAQVTVIRVAGAFELPLVAASVASDYDAIVALGVIIRGGTPHFEYVSDAVTTGLTRVALDTATPVGFGILTTDNEQQALDRAGLADSIEDKGAEAASAALNTVQVLRSQARTQGAVGFGQ